MAFQGDSIYWVEVEKVVPNPFQPRREFDESKLQELSESIRMYGVLQPLTVTRQEVQKEDGTFFSQYELIAGERRLRASKLAGVAQVPVIIREGEDSEQEKLELAIIENLQREDLNAIDRALAFQQLAEQFNLNHAEVGRKVGRSREYVANSIRLLNLPQHMRDSVQRGELGEGHARTLLMLSEKPEEQETLFREVLLKKMSVRELERITRKIATDKVRKQNPHDIGQHLIDLEKEFTETLGTRVQIQKTEFGGKLTIDYFSEEDLSALLQKVKDEQAAGQRPVLSGVAAAVATESVMSAPVVRPVPVIEQENDSNPSAPESAFVAPTPAPTPAPTRVEPTMPISPVTHAQSTAPMAQPSASSAADQSLLERLAAHTPLTFTKEQSPVPVSPEQESVPVSPTPATPPSVPQNLVSSAPMSDLPESPQEPTEPEDDDLYSMRNFTV